MKRRPGPGLGQRLRGRRVPLLSPSREPLLGSPRNLQGKNAPAGSVLREARIIGTCGRAGGHGVFNLVSLGRPGAQRGSGAAQPGPLRSSQRGRSVRTAPSAPASLLIADVRPAPSPPPPEERAAAPGAAGAGDRAAPAPHREQRRCPAGERRQPRVPREKSCDGARGKSPAESGGRTAERLETSADPACSYSSAPPGTRAALRTGLKHERPSLWRG